MKKNFLRAAACIACSMLMVSSLAACGCLPNEVNSEKAAISPDYEKSLQNELFKYDIFNDHAVITSYIGSETAVEVPEMIDDKPVTELATSAFTDSSNTVKKVKIPKTVTNINKSCFSGNKIEEFEIDSDNTEYIVESGAIMDSSRTKLIAYAAACSADEFTIPNTVTSVPSGVFSQCPNLKKINIPSSVKSIDTFAFVGSGLTEVILPEGVESIGMGAFWNCKSLETLELPKSLTNITAPETICQSCTALKTVKGYDSTEAQKITEGEDVNAEYVSLG